VLSSQEQQVWDDVQRFWAEEAREPPLPTPGRTTRVSRDETDLPVAVVAGSWITITLILLGAVLAGLAVGLATGLGWALWRVWPRLGEPGARRISPRSGNDAWFAD